VQRARLLLLALALLLLLVKGSLLKVALLLPYVLVQMRRRCEWVWRL
jgi:hypothetical protein